MTSRPEPALQRVSRRWIGLFRTRLDGVWLAQLAPFQLTLPEQVNDWLDIGDDVTAGNWRRSVLTFGVVSGISAIFASSRSR